MLKKAVGLVITLLVLVVLIVVVGRLILLNLTFDQLNQSYMTLRRQYSQKTQSELCVSEVDSAQSVDYQLRFVSPSQYVIEVVCFSKPLEGIELSRYKLPRGVVRSGGSVGVGVNQTAQPMQLAVFSDLISVLPTTLQSKLQWLVGHKTLIFADGQVSEIKDQTILPSWTEGGVRSSCQAFGYGCCHEQNQAGQGQLAADAIDCPGRCYARCLVKPLVVSFGADGSFDPMSRSVEVIGGGELNFSYVGQAGSVPIKSATISFGDGQNVDLNSDQTSTSHQYNCSSSVCHYSATITLIDEQNLTSPPTALTLLQVVVRQ